MCNMKPNATPNGAESDSHWCRQTNRCDRTYTDKFRSVLVETLKRSPLQSHSVPEFTTTTTPKYKNMERHFSNANQPLFWLEGNVCATHYSWKSWASGMTDLSYSCTLLPFIHATFCSLVEQDESPLAWVLNLKKKKNQNQIKKTKSKQQKPVITYYWGVLCSRRYKELPKVLRRRLLGHHKFSSVGLPT